MLANDLFYNQYILILFYFVTFIPFYIYKVLTLLHCYLVFMIGRFYRWPFGWRARGFMIEFRLFVTFSTQHYLTTYTYIYISRRAKKKRARVTESKMHSNTALLCLRCAFMDFK